MTTIKKIFVLPVEYAERLRTASFETRKSQSQLVREGLDLVFERDGGTPAKTGTPMIHQAAESTGTGAGSDDAAAS